MPKYKNRFIAPAYIEETIIDEGGNTIGTIRVKPSAYYGSQVVRDSSILFRLISSPIGLSRPPQRPDAQKANVSVLKKLN